MINIFQPQVGEPSLENLSEVFKSNWLGRGEWVSKFEVELAKFLNCKRSNLHTIASCSDAIFAALRVFNFPKGSEVIIPSISFPAVGSAILECDLVPRIIDIDIKTGNINLDSLKKNMNENVVAVFATDYGGIPCDIQKIRTLTGSKIKILLDSAASLGSFVNNKFSGEDADFCCWSFDAMKLVTCGEGGASYFKDSEKLERFKEYCYLGFSSSEKSGMDRSGSTDTWWEYDPLVAGRRSVFTNINAAIGLPSLENISKALSRKAEIRAIYTELFDSLPIEYLVQNEENVVYSNYFCSLVVENRNQLANFLKSEGVYSTFRYHPLHKMTLFEKYAGDCKNADYFSNKTLNIPIHQNLSDDDVSIICRKIEKFYK